VQLKLGYSDEMELKPIIPAINGEIKGDISISPVKVKEDDLKFMIKELDLAFIPLPIINFINNIKIITNGAFVVNTMGLKRLNNRQDYFRVCVKGSNSTEYYISRIFVPQKLQPVVSDSTSCDGDLIISFDDRDIDFDQFWKRACDGCPFVLDVVGSINLDFSTLSKIKVLFRESAKIQEERGVILRYSKELGLKGKEAIKTFFDLCNRKRLCNVDYRKLEIV